MSRTFLFSQKEKLMNAAGWVLAICLTIDALALAVALVYGAKSPWDY